MKNMRQVTKEEFDRTVATMGDVTAYITGPWKKREGYTVKWRRKHALEAFGASDRGGENRTDRYFLTK